MTPKSRSAALFVRRRRAETQRPLGPRVARADARAAGAGRSSSDATARGALAERRADAVGARVAAADDDDVLAGRPRWAALDRVAGDAAVLLREEVHGEVHAGELARRARARSRGARAPTAEHDGVEARPQLVGR